MGKLARFLPLLLLFVLAAGLTVRLVQMQSPAPTTGVYQDPMLGKPMPALTLPPLDADASPVQLAQMQGTPYLFNVFASWCAMCKIEHTHLQALKERTGLPLYGMTWRDAPEKTRAWLARHGNIYDVIGTDAQGMAALDLGLTGAPETYLVAADGTIAAIYRGALSESIIDTRFIPAVNALTAAAQSDAP